MITSVNLSRSCSDLVDHWSPKVVGRVNNQYVKVAKLLGQLAWQKHEDEMFQVLKGVLRIQVEGKEDVVLMAGEFCVIPRDTLHNPIAEQECWIMLIETVTTKHTGDVQTPSTRPIQEQLNLAAREIETSSQDCAFSEGL
jgi:mannose-6-phosphate isomerase-like protein (cupin superfamily)